MANLNKVMLMGNLTRDPELSFLPSNTAICKMGLATNRKWTAADGQQKEEVTFVDLTAFGKQAEILAKYLKKGKPVYIEGRLKFDQWEAQDGSKRSKLHVIVDGFQFIDSRQPGDAPPGGGEGGGGGGGGGGYQQRQPAARQPMRAPARPAAAPAPYNDSDPIPEDDGPPPIREDDIPF